LLREYEFTLIARADLPDAEKAKVFERYEQMLTEGGEMLKRDDWGSRRLAYPIKEQFRGHYVLYDYVGKSENLAEVERLMRIDDNVLRYMSVKIGQEIDVTARKAELAKIAADAAEAESRDRDRDRY